MRRLLILLLVGAICAPVALQANALLFPSPLHLTRQISDPVSQSTSIVDEFCYANRVVSVSNDRTSIVDFATRELTTIDSLTYQSYRGANGSITYQVETNSASYTTLKLLSTTSCRVHVTNSCGTANSVTATVTIKRSLRGGEPSSGFQRRILPRANLLGPEGRELLQISTPQ